MAMVGLFWITEDSVYVGSPPNAEGHCVRLTSEGIGARGPDGVREWPWSSLRSAVVEAVPVEGAARGAGRFLAAVLEAVVTLGSSYGGEEPPQMFLVLETQDGAEEVRVPAATGGYTSQEIALSQRLLARCREGTSDPRILTAWSRDHLGGSPKPSEREALLRKWTTA
ncbi:hypothetical protein J7F03_08335 [Streptomyces sp. ISL-43]|uniref:hypothetical protein n=1 Tax=Streptomyces sp. ISL-43 TaxID=2819183 RepID=UPI001BE5A426|nr:hypothetical protein [Streptomyces sp. ISL-43]MBT2447081.1 hypothetical protein [Streptomyces sp. ISL-43]